MQDTDAAKKHVRNRLSTARVCEIEQEMATLIEAGHPLEAVAITLKIDIKQARKIYTDMAQRGEISWRVPDYIVVASTKSIWTLFSKTKVNTYMKVERQKDGSFIIRPYNEA